MNGGSKASVVITTDIPGEVKSFHYVRNHHYLKLQDREGNEALLLEYGVIMYSCEACGFRWWSEENRAAVCPCCCCEEIKQQWVSPQVALLPEKESGFQLIKDKDK